MAGENEVVGGGQPVQAGGQDQGVPAGGGQAGAAPTAAPAVPVGEGGGAGQSAGGGGGAGQSAQAWASIRDAAREMGYDLSRYQDDRSALGALVQRAQAAEQASELARYGQYFLEHRQQFEQWRGEQEKAKAAQAAAAETSWWKAPEYDPRWRQMVQKDPVTGKLVAAEGAPPDVVQKYLTAVQHQQEFLDKFTFDPIGAVKPGIEEVARQIALQVVQQHLGGYSDTQHAQTYIQQNSSWLHERDASGNLVGDQQGRPQLSQAGQRFLAHFEQGVRMGIQGEQQRASYARAMVEREFAVAAYQQSQQRAAQVTQGEQQKQALVNRGAGTGGAAHVPAAGGSTGGRVQNSGLPLEERLRQNLASAGVTEATLAASRGGRRGQ